MASLNPQTLVREGQPYFITRAQGVESPLDLTVSGALNEISASNGASTFVWTETVLAQTSTIRQDASGVTILDETSAVLTCISGNTIIPQSLTVQLFGNPQGFITIATTSVSTIIKQSTAGATVELTSNGNVNIPSIQVGTIATASVNVGPDSNPNRATTGPSRFAFGTGGMYQAGSSIFIDSANTLSRQAIQINNANVTFSQGLSCQDDLFTTGSNGISTTGSIISTLGTKQAILTSLSPPAGYSGRLYAYDTATATNADLTLQGSAGAFINKSTFSTPTNIFLVATGTGKKVKFNSPVKIVERRPFWAYYTQGDQLIPNATSVAAADANTMTLYPIYVDPRYGNVLTTVGPGILKSQFEPPVTGLYEFILTLQIMSPEPDPTEYMLRWGANMAVYKTNYTPGQPSVSTFISYVLPMQTYSEDKPTPFVDLAQVSSYETLTWKFVYPMVRTAVSNDTLRFIPTFVDTPNSSAFPTSTFQTRIGPGTTLFIRLI
jgi:hypothetical protein